MAGKGDPQNKGAAQRAKYRPQSEFVQYNVTEKERAALKLTEFTGENMVDTIQELAEAGYKVTFRWDDYADCNAAWIIAPDDSDDNKGLILSGRGSSAIKAFKQASWLHYQRFK